MVGSCISRHCHHSLVELSAISACMVKVKWDHFLEDMMVVIVEDFGGHTGMIIGPSLHMGPMSSMSPRHW